MKKSFKLILGVAIALVLMITCAFTVFAYSDSECPHNDYYYDSYYGYNKCNSCNVIFECKHYQTYDNGTEALCEGCGEFLGYTYSCDHYSAYYNHDVGMYYCYYCGEYFENYTYCLHEHTHYSSHYGSMICNSCSAPVETDLSEYKIQTALILLAGILLAPWALLLYIICILIVAVVVFIVGFIIVLLTPILILVGIPIALSSGLLIIF